MNKNDELKEKDIELAQKMAVSRQKVLAELRKVIVGQDEVVNQLLISLFSRGHCLIVGVPGLAKTLLISTLAQILDLKFNRVQFTPDLMPSDITGTEVIQDNVDTGERVFRFIQGPVFANIVLADEINRTPPKTQSALLQAMQEYKVTVAGKTYELPLPFFVLATQNPIEQEGTYPLPEAQLDRFLFQINIGYPSYDEEKMIVTQTTSDYTAKIEKMLTSKEILELQDIVRRVPVSEYVTNYAVTLVRMTRPGDCMAPEYVRNWLTWGAGPRASQSLILSAKARAVLSGNYAVSTEDIDYVLLPVLRHRLILNFNAEAENVTVDTIVEKLKKEAKKQ
ncbi:MAG: MoxR family ATPase [Elusimicrobiota bacterium]